MEVSKKDYFNFSISKWLIIFLYVLGAIDQDDIELVDEHLLPSAEVEGIPDLTEIYGTNILDIDGPISLKNRNFYQKCFLCKDKPIFSDYATKLSFTFDGKFVLSVFISLCITGILIMNV